MRAIFVLIDTSVDHDELMPALTEYGTALKTFDGLIMKTWISQSEGTFGGFCVFRDSDSANRYINDMLRPTEEAHPALSNLRIQHFEVLQELSALNGFPIPALEHL